MIRLWNPDPPAWNRAEILRYARVKADDQSISRLMEECINESESVLCYRICYSVLELDRNNGVMRFGNIETSSETINKATRGCDGVLLFAATVGATFDRLISRYSAVQPSKALLLQAIGAERVESLCDAFCQKMNDELNLCAKSLRTRVSPGYGDIPLSMQREVFALLDCPRKIGLTLGDGLMMSPSKSVTAIAGIGVQKDAVINKKCSDCQNSNCVYRT